MDLVVYGAGGMGRELIWQISSQNTEQYNILGFVDDSDNKLGSVINGFQVVGNTQWLLNRNEPIAVAVALGDSEMRKRTVASLKKNNNISFPNIISSDAIISDYVEMGEGNIICFNSIITVNIKIGNFLLCNRSCNIGHDVELSDYVTLNPNVTLSGNVKVGDCVNIGTGSVVIQGKNIGDNTVIGAGAVVTSNIPDNCTAVGVPAKPIKFQT